MAGDCMGTNTLNYMYKSNENVVILSKAIFYHCFLSI